MSLYCRAILFDLDGVLVDSRPVVERTWARWAALRGVTDPDLVDRAHGRRSIETVSAVAPELDPAAEARWLAAVEMSDVAGLAVIPGAASLLASLSRPDWAVVTSGGRELAVLRLQHVGLPQPAVLIAAEDVAAGKPAPDGYLLAARRLGVVPAECVVVEDTPPGIRAGRAAGAKVLAVTTTFPASALREADAVVATLVPVRVARQEDRMRLDVATVAHGSD